MVLTLVSSLIGGALLLLGFPPFAFAPLGWVGVGVLLWSWRNAATPARAGWAAYLGGTAFFGGLFWWLGNVELVAYLPLVVVQAAAFPIVAQFARRFAADSHKVWIVVATGSWALSEYLRVRWPFGGFPWGTVGLTVAGTPLMSSAQWIGATGWTVLLVATAAAAVVSVEERRVVRPLVATVGTVAVLAALGVVSPPDADGPQVSIAVVQGNSPCPGSSCPDERFRIYESHLTLTQSLPVDTFDLVVWPESSTGFTSDPILNPDVALAIGAEARRLGSHILVGGDRPIDDDAFINANVIFGPDGEIIAEYRKRHPVPFGEYVPMRPLVEWIPAIARVPRDMTRGDGVVLIDLPQGTVGSVISYEGAFARYEREMVGEGAQLMVVATNEASFGRSPASDQFVAMSQVRSAEMGVDLVHAAVTGKSALIETPGRIVEETGLFTTEVATATLALADDGPTLYVRFGDLLAAVAIVALLGVSAERSLRQRVST